MAEGAVGLTNGPTSDFEVLCGPASEATTPVSLSHINPMTGSQGPGSITDITLEQALARVRDLSKENAELQSYLRENNEMMKRQFETLSKWKQKVHEANQTNREKFDQTKSLIISLRKNKDELQERIDELEQTMRERENDFLTRLRTMETAKATSQQVAISLKRQAEEQGMSMTEPDINIQETVMVAMSAEKEEMIQDLEDKVRMLESNVSDLNDTIARRELKVQQFRANADQLLKDLESAQAIKDEMQKENAQLSEEKFRLQQRLHSLISDTTTSLRLVERGQRLGHPNVEGDRLMGNAESEPVEVTQLIDQLQRAQKQHEQEVSHLKQEMQEKHEKEKSVTEQLKCCEQEKANLIQRHENEITKINKEHDQKIMEFIRQHNTEKEQQLQSVSSSHDNDVQSLRAQVLTLISEVHETQTKLAVATSTLEKKDVRIKDGEQKITKLWEELNYQKQESDRIVANLEIALENTKKNWEQERAEHQRTKYHFQELQKSFNQLVDDYKELLDTFEQYNQDENQRSQSDRLSELAAQVMAANETICTRQEQIENLNVEKQLLIDEFQEMECVYKAQDENQRSQSDRLSELAAQVMAANETICARQEQIENHNAEKQRLIDEFQEMECVYKAQAEVYKTDFEAERQAREQQVCEKEQILQDMQELQVNNQQLMDKLKSSQRQVTDMQRGPASTGHPPVFRPPDQATVGAVTGQPPPIPYQNPSQGHQPPERPPNAYQTGPIYPPTGDHHQHDEDEPLVCPQCNIELPNMDLLQIHVLECLDKYEFNNQRS
ncbi:optineurin-like [Gigantopelta aegis]|uniref:optineurin-like n=1 Tax=Gigantopelta aegis TaxID=1735272 RepID=UPI001B88D83F|nr:optineurin-like [Gigantopelta aegis]